MKTKVVIAGAGHLGLYLGGRLLEQQASVAFLGRSQQRTLAFHDGITLFDPAMFAQHIPVDLIEFHDTPEIIREAHWIWLTSKNQDVAPLCDEIAPYIRPGARLVSFQGMQSRAYLRKRFPQLMVQSVVVPFSITALGHGYLKQAYEAALIAERESEPSSEHLEELLKTMSIPYQMTDQIFPVMWGNILLNLKDAINALSGLSSKEGFSQKGFRAVLAHCLEEALDVYDKAGIRAQIPSALPARLLIQALRMPDAIFNRMPMVIPSIKAEALSSMWRDLDRFKQTEIEFTYGEILKLADQFSVPVPTVRHIYDLVKSIELQRMGCPSLTAESLMPGLGKAA